MAEGLEGPIKKQIMDYLRLLGYKVHRMNSGGKKVPGGYIHLCKSGTPDLLVFGKHKFILWIECKRPGEKPTEGQESEMFLYRAMGHETLVADNLDTVIEYFNNVG